MNYQKITKNDIANGFGVRITLWVSGCNHKCPGCHNEITWPTCSGQEFTKETESELFEALDKPYISGITFSGGDPMNPKNYPVIAYLMQKIHNKFPDKNIWLYTGYTLGELLGFARHDLLVRVALTYADTIVDGEFKEDLKDITYPWAGSTNQHIWVKAKANGARVSKSNYIRVSKSDYKDWVIADCEKEWRENHCKE